MDIWAGAVARVLLWALPTDFPDEHQSLYVRTIIHKTGNQGLQYRRHLCLKMVINGKQIVAPPVRLTPSHVFIAEASRQTGERENVFVICYTKTSPFFF